MQVVKEKGPGLASRAPAEVRGAAWQVLRVAAEHAAGSALQPEPRVEQRAHEGQAVAQARPPQAPRGSVGVSVVEAVVLLVVAVYFVAGLAAALAS